MIYKSSIVRQNNLTPNLEMSYLLIPSQKNAILFPQEFSIQIKVYTNRHYLKGHCIQHLECYFHLTVYRP